MSNVIILKSDTKAYRKILLWMFWKFHIVVILNILPLNKSQMWHALVIGLLIS